MDDSSSVQYPGSEASLDDRPGTSQYALQSLSSSSLPNSVTAQDDQNSSTRQKRKRTSPEDQAILEAAYQRDAKPDKIARSRLVEQVALNEKEVQIWFQNRRQSSRRKSRPLLPHEVAQYQMARSSMSGVDSSQLPNVSPSMVAGHDPDSIITLAEASTEGPAQNLTSTPLIPHPEPHSHEIRHMTVLPSQEQRASQGQAQLRSSTDQKCRTRRSRVRLSMHLGGNASVVTKDVNSPSPQRPRRTSSAGLLPNVAMPADTGDKNGGDTFRARIQRSVSGRSRDSRAWEFWCDKESRSELEDKAEKDANGSAADAIGLLRSSSGRNILGPVLTKRNSLLSRRPSEAKRSRVEGKSRSLHRSSTSHGRLHGDANDAKKSRFKHSEKAMSVYIPGNESDKENWSPLEYQQGAEGSRGKNEKRNDIRDPESDPEIVAFMSGGRENRNLSSDDDLNCVEGLLSLSRGGR